MSAKIKMAHSMNAQQESFKIRHRVYCEEQGWEPVVAAGTESDYLDRFANHVVLRDESSDTAIGSVRIIPASLDGVNIILPIERKFGASLANIFPSQTLPSRSRIAEVSRLAVLPEYRKMLDEPSPVLEQAYSGAMRFHAVRLFLGALACAQDQNMVALVLLTEPKLFRYLRALGFRHTHVGTGLDFHGVRVPILANVDEVLSSLPNELRLALESLAA